MSDSTALNTLLKKMKNSIEQAKNILDSNHVNLSVLDDESQSVILTKITDAKDALNEISNKYEILLNKQIIIYENLIGASIGKYYIDYTYSLIDKLEKFNKFIKLLDQLLNGKLNIDEYQKLIASNNEYQDIKNEILNTFNKLLESFTDVSEGIISSNENGVIHTYDSSGSVISDLSKKLVRYAETIDSSTGIKSQYILTSVNDNNDKIYVSAPLLKMTNVPVYKDTTDIIRFLWIPVGHRTSYLGIVDPSDGDEEDFYGIKFTFRSWLITRNFTDKAMTRVTIQTGYSVRAVDNDTVQYKPESNKKLAVFDGEDHTVINFKSKDYIITEKDIDGDSVDLSKRTTKVKLCYEGDVQSVVMFDRESYKIESSSLADNVKIIINPLSNTYGTFEFNNMNIDADKGENYQYTFKGTIGYGENTDGLYAKNQIPLLLKADINKQGNNVKTKIRVGVDPDNNAILTEKNAYYAIGLMIFDDKEYVSTYDVTDLINYSPEYKISNVLTTLKYLDDIYDNKNKKVNALSSISNEIVQLKDSLKEFISSDLSKINSLLTTFVNGESVRESEDSYYDKEYYESLINDINTVTTDIQSFQADTIDISKISEDITKLYNTVNSLIDESLESLDMIDQVVGSYSPIFGNNVSYYKVITSMKTAFSIYSGKDDFSDALNISSNGFLTINFKNYDYDAWEEYKKESIRENTLIIYKYYLIGILLSKLSKKSSENLISYKSYLSYYIKQLYTNNILPETLFDNTPVKNYILEERKLYNNYGLVVYKNINHGNIPVILSNNMNSINKLNNVDLLNYINNNKLSDNLEYLVLQLGIALFKTNNIVYNIEFLSKYLNKCQNLRCIILSIALNKLIDKFENTPLYIDIKKYKTNQDELISLCNSYIEIWDALYSNTNKISIYDLLPSYDNYSKIDIIRLLK